MHSLALGAAKLAVGVATVASVGTAVAPAAHATTHRTYPRVSVTMLGAHGHRLPACRTEDSRTACVWDAKHRGNGRGESFFVDATGRAVAIYGDGDVTVRHHTYRIVYSV